MAQKLEEWLDTEVEEISKHSVGELSNLYFFRDPLRSNFIDYEHFYSPADGVILYQKFLENANDPVVEVKGVNYTLKDILGDKSYDKPSLVIGIFMTFYDVHINRIPYGGRLTYKSLDPIESTNIPMLATEKDILNMAINPDNLSYIKNNERVCNKIYNALIDYTYYVVQIADEDVDVIQHFTTDQNEIFSQNERFSLIRWGSQCDLILPLDDRFDFEVLLDDTNHVKAGLDKLVKINFKRNGH